MVPLVCVIQVLRSAEIHLIGKQDARTDTDTHKPLEDQSWQSFAAHRPGQNTAQGSKLSGLAAAASSVIKPYV